MVIIVKSKAELEVARLKYKDHQVTILGLGGTGRLTIPGRYKDQKVTILYDDILLTDLKNLLEGVPQEEREQLIKKYRNPRHAEIFLEGYQYSWNKLKPILMETIKENKELSQRSNSEIKREHLKKVMSEHTRNGKPNWVAIGKALGCSDKTAKTRAKNLTLIK